MPGSVPCPGSAVMKRKAFATSVQVWGPRLAALGALGQLSEPVIAGHMVPLHPS